MQLENHIVCKLLLVTKPVAIHDLYLKPMATDKLCLKLIAKIVVIGKLYCKAVT